MIVHPSEMPSRGLDKNSETINIPSLGFQDLLLYTREYEAAKTPVHKYLVDFKWIREKISNWDKINLIDLDYVILLFKKCMISDKNEFSVEKACSECGEINELNLEVTQISYALPIEYMLGGAVRLGPDNREYEFYAPNLAFFKSVVDKVSRSGRCKDIDLIKLIAFFPEFEKYPNKYEALVLNAKQDDIVVLSTLKSIYLRSEVNIKYHCSKCKGGNWSLRVNTLIDNVFLSLVKSASSTESKISVKQIC